MKYYKLLQTLGLLALFTGAACTSAIAQESNSQGSGSQSDSQFSVNNDSYSDSSREGSNDQDRESAAASSRSRGDRNADREDDNSDRNQIEDGERSWSNNHSPNSNPRRDSFSGQHRGDSENASSRDENETAALGVVLASMNGRLQVARVLRESPANEAGLRPGDEVLSIDGRRYNSARQLSQAVGQMDPDDQVEVQVRRNGRTMTLQASLDERDELFQQQAYRGQSGQQSQFYGGDQRGSRNYSSRDSADSRELNELRNEVSHLRQEMSRLAQRLQRIDGNRSDQSYGQYDNQGGNGRYGTNNSNSLNSNSLSGQSNWGSNADGRSANNQYRDGSQSRTSGQNRWNNSPEGRNQNYSSSSQSGSQNSYPGNESYSDRTGPQEDADTNRYQSDSYGSDDEGRDAGDRARD
jgi:hypothetical protein